MTTRAVRQDGGYRITGTKHFITNGGEADFIVVFAKTDPEAGSRGIGAFVVEGGAEGLVAAPAEKTMGVRGSHVFELSLDCLVGEDKRIGSETGGFKTAMKVLDRGRIDVSAMGLGIARAALEAALSWSRERVGSAGC